MKTRIRTILLNVAVAASAVISLTGCYESRYVRHYNHHTRGWYDRRHVAPPQGTNFEVDVYKRRY